ncbi:MAG: GspI family T2SS minor pseudopilin variant LspI [Legionellales bacterium]
MKKQPALYRVRGSGFTLVEVLLALAVIAIALTAMLKVTAQNIETTHRIKEKSISHWIAMQAVSMIQLNLIAVNQSQESTQATTMFDQKWFWRAQIKTSPMPTIQLITISVSAKEIGPFREELTAFRYVP